MKKILISACLASDLLRYDSRGMRFKEPLLINWSQKGMLVKVCPEVSGGLKIPRPEAQIVKGSGPDVLQGAAKVIDIQGNDITRPFVRGAEYILSLEKRLESRFFQKMNWIR